MGDVMEGQALNFDKALSAMEAALDHALRVSGLKEKRAATSERLSNPALFLPRDAAQVQPGPAP